MDLRKNALPLAALAAVFFACYYLPVGTPRFDGAVLQSLALVKWYAREHVLLCLVPAFFIAGAVGVFVNSASVMKYLGARANKTLAYGVAAVSGSILAVCSCTVLPLFAGIWRMGAGLGPATAFLYSGPAINIMAIILTARVLGVELGVARAVGAIAFSIVIGLAMHWIYRHEESDKAAAQAALPEPPAGRPLWQTAAFFAVMVGILVFANWSRPQARVRIAYAPSAAVAHVWTGAIERESLEEIDIRVESGPDRIGAAVILSKDMIGALKLEITPVRGTWERIHEAKWHLVTICALVLAALLVGCFGMAAWRMGLVGTAVVAAAILAPQTPLVPFVAGVAGLILASGTQGGAAREWMGESWSFALKILPLLLAGVLVAGFLLGQPGQEGIIPASWIAQLVGGNGVGANCFAAVFGAFMYFATLTEVPIVQGLMNAGMGKGPTLALLLAGPALSLPNMLVLRGIMGTGKTVVYVSLVIVMSAGSGLLYGWLCA